MTYNRLSNNTCFSVCGCGCIHPREDLVRYRKSDVSQLRCPDHFETEKGRVAYRIGVCQKCGQRVKFSARGGTVPQWCPECRTGVRKKRMREYAKTWNSPEGNCMKIHNNHLRDNSRWDCAERDACLDKWDGYDCIPCKGCEDYLQTVQVAI